MPAVAPRRVLKAPPDAPRGRASSPTAGANRWNLIDFESDLSDRLAEAERRCTAMLAAARSEADAIREAARAEGHAAGTRDGAARVNATAAQKIAERAAALADARVSAAGNVLTAAADRLDSERDRLLGEWEAEFVHLSLAVAERLLRRTLSTDPSAVGPLVSEVLAHAAGLPRPVVRMHPADLAVLGEDGHTLVRSAMGEHGRIEPDDALARGDCVVTAEDGEVDGRLSARLDRIAAELLPDVDR